MVNARSIMANIGKSIKTMNGGDQIAAIVKRMKR